MFPGFFFELLLEWFHLVWCWLFLGNLKKISWDLWLLQRASLGPRRQGPYWGFVHKSQKPSFKTLCQDFHDESHNETMPFTCSCRVWSQVRGRLVDKRPRRKHAPLFHGASYPPYHWVSSSHVHAAVGGADADLWTCAAKPGSIGTHKHCVNVTEFLSFTVFIHFLGSGCTYKNRI